MSSNRLFLIPAILACMACRHHSPIHRENGWYLLRDHSRDSLSVHPVATVKEFMGIHISPMSDGRACIIGNISPLRSREWAGIMEGAAGSRMYFVLNDSVISGQSISRSTPDGTFSITLPTASRAHRIYHRLLAEKADSMDALFAQIGWEKNDSLWAGFTPRVQDSVINVWDYIKAKALVDKQQERQGHWQKDSTHHNPDTP